MGNNVSVRGIMKMAKNLNFECQPHYGVSGIMIDLTISKNMKIREAYDFFKVIQNAQTQKEIEK